MMARPKNRSAFTLVELLVVITVIGILVGMLLVVLGPARNRVGEFVIQQEMTQMGAAMEKFKTAYNFYPPDFSAFDPDPVIAVNQFLLFLNRIAPQHGELTYTIPGDTTSPRYIDVWWNEVGQFLDTESSMVFWLSGLAQNKQFPLTYFNTASGFREGLAAHPFNLDGVDRIIMFDFQTDRVHIDGNPKIAKYDQPSGNNDSHYRYFRYTPSLMNNPTTGAFDLTLFLGYHNGTTTEPVDAVNPFAPANFQMVAAGMDGLFGSGNTSDPTIPFGRWNDPMSPLPKEAEDDIVNFISDGSTGRLDRKLLGTD